MRRVAVLGLAVLFALPLFSAAAVVPIPVQTDADTAGWSDGVYVQEQHVRRGPVDSCSIHVQTTADGVGETMTATDGVGSYQAPVNGISQDGVVVAGRATFSVADGVTLTTTNTDVAVSGTCPSAGLPE